MLDNLPAIQDDEEEEFEDCSPTVEQILKDLTNEIRMLRREINELKNYMDSSKISNTFANIVYEFKDINHIIQDNFKRLNGLINQTKGVVVMNQTQAHRVANRSIP
jgi:hypothetical protein